MIHQKTKQIFSQQMASKLLFFSVLCICFCVNGSLFANEPAAAQAEPEKYTPAPFVMHHIGDANEFHIVGDLTIPLPIIAYHKAEGFFFSLSSAFEHGRKAIRGYAMDHGVLRKIEGFPEQGTVELESLGEHDGHTIYVHSEEKEINGKKGIERHVKFNGTTYQCSDASTLMAGSSWYDFSITKNVFTMLLSLLILCFVFFSVKNSLINRRGKAPTGLQNFFEPFFIFIRDEVAKPAIGPKYEKYLPFISALFFFILVNNLLGLIPFFPGGANVMGNIGTTAVLAICTFIVVMVSTNKHFWQHVFWMPNVPVPIKILFIPIEIASIFIKPFTLLIRLFANITAGHTIILSFVALVFIFGKCGASMSGGIIGAIMSFLFVAFMNLLEILVAVLQAFIFALLTSIYIGGAVEEHH